MMFNVGDLVECLETFHPGPIKGQLYKLISVRPIDSGDVCRWGQWLGMECWYPGYPHICDGTHANFASSRFKLVFKQKVVKGTLP